MKLYNYLKVAGAFTNAYQLIEVTAEPKDRTEKKMLEEAWRLIDAGWARRVAFLEKRSLTTGEAPELEAEKEAFYPKVVDGVVAMPLQYIQDYVVKKMAALQNNMSIHNTKEVAELMELFGDYGVTLTRKFELVFDRVTWSAKPGQKPKLMVHAREAVADGEAEGEEVCVRFEAAGELCQKFMMAVLSLELKPGQTFRLSVSAVDPAIAKNERAGKKVADTGVFVNHNLTLSVGGKTHTGHPPKGERFVQKPTMEFMEALFRQVQHATEGSTTAGRRAA